MPSKKSTTAPVAQQRAIQRDYDDIKSALINTASAIVLIDKNLNFFTKFIPPTERAIIMQELHKCNHQAQLVTASLREVLKLIDTHLLSQSELQLNQDKHNAKIRAKKEAKLNKMTEEEREAHKKASAKRRKEYRKKR